MAEYIVRNSLNPNKVVKFGITLTQLVPKGNSGELIWLVFIATNELDFEGNVIPVRFINLTSLKNLDREIEKVTSEISELIDWGPLEEDILSPKVISSEPTEYLADIDSNVKLTIKDSFPSAGIDVNSISMTVNGTSVTDELIIEGDPYEYKITWRPFLRVRATYE